MINTEQVKDKTGDVLILQSENPTSFSTQKSDTDGLLALSNFIRCGTEIEWVQEITWKRIRLESPNSFLEETQIEKFS